MHNNESEKKNQPNVCVIISSWYENGKSVISVKMTILLIKLLKK